MMPTIQLPSELIVQILSHIDDKNILSRCSLVCYAWLSLASKGLFHNLNFDPTSHYRCADTYEGLLDYLRSTPRASQFIQELHLEGSYDVEDPLESTRYVADVCLALQVLRRITTCLPNLRVLKLERILLVKSCDGLEDVKEPSLEVKKALRRVVFSDIVSSPEDYALLDVLSLFSSIDELRLEYVTQLILRPSIKVPSNHFGLRIRSLLLVYCTAGPVLCLFNGLLAIMDRQCLEDLSIEIVNLTACKQFFETFGSSLTRLTLYLDIPLTGHAENSNVASMGEMFQRCPNLNELCLSIPIYLEDHERPVASHTLLWAFTIIRGAFEHGLTIRCVSLSFHIYDWMQRSRLDDSLVPDLLRELDWSYIQRGAELCAKKAAVLDVHTFMGRFMEHGPTVKEFMSRLADAKLTARARVAVRC